MGNRPVRIVFPYFIQMQSRSKLSAEITVAQSYFLSGNMKRAHLESLEAVLWLALFMQWVTRLYSLGSHSRLAIWVCVSGGCVSGGDMWAGLSNAISSTYRSREGGSPGKLSLTPGWCFPYLLSFMRISYLSMWIWEWGQKGKGVKKIV